MRFDPQTRRLSLNPRDPAFFADPYAAYASLHASPGPVFWEDYGFWCFAGHAEVSSAVARQALRPADPARGERARSSAGRRVPAHLAAFDALERHSLLELEPPEHTRLRALVNRAFVSRQVERLAPRIAELAERLDRQARAPAQRSHRGLRDAHPCRRDRRAARRRRVEDGAAAARLVAQDGGDVSVRPDPRRSSDAAAAASREFTAFLRRLCRACGAARGPSAISSASLISAKPTTAA